MHWQVKNEERKCRFAVLVMCVCSPVHMSNVGAAFCCPSVSNPAYAIAQYYDWQNIEGAHSCLAFSAVTTEQNPTVGNNLCQNATFNPSAHLLTSLQSVPINVTGSGLLSVAAALAWPFMCSASGFRTSYPEFRIGLFTATGSSTPTAWAWVDGTNSTNVNCGVHGCGIWSPSEPRSVSFTDQPVWAVLRTLGQIALSNLPRMIDLLSTLFFYLPLNSGDGSATAGYMLWPSGCLRPPGLDDNPYVLYTQANPAQDDMRRAMLADAVVWIWNLPAWQWQLRAAADV